MDIFGNCTLYLKPESILSTLSSFGCNYSWFARDVTKLILKSKLTRPAKFLSLSGEGTAKNISCHKFPAQ